MKRLKRMKQMITEKLVRKESLTGDGQITICCGASVGLVKVNRELFVRCSNCHEYIGNVVCREIGILESRFEENILEACSEQGILVLTGDDKIADLFPLYCDYLEKFARQAARSTVRDSKVPLKLNKR
jgi:hypothetical protein